MLVSYKHFPGLYSMSQETFGSRVYNHNETSIWSFFYIKLEKTHAQNANFVECSIYCRIFCSEWYWANSAVIFHMKLLSVVIHSSPLFLHFFTLLLQCEKFLVSNKDVDRTYIILISRLLCITSLHVTKNQSSNFCRLICRKKFVLYCIENVDKPNRIISRMICLLKGVPTRFEGALSSNQADKDTEQ